jgi:hypothetical protein
MNTKDKPPIKKASSDPVKEAKGHPDGPSLLEMINCEEQKVLNKKRKPEDSEPKGGPIPVI